MDNYGQYYNGDEGFVTIKPHQAGQLLRDIINGGYVFDGTFKSFSFLNKGWVRLKNGQVLYKSNFSWLLYGKPR